MNLNPSLIVIVAVLGFATLLGWSYSRGRRGILRLHMVALIVLLALVAASASQTLQLPGFLDAAIVTAIAFSFAGCTTTPSLWREEIRSDLERTELFAPLVPRDWLSWRGWLKLVDRLGAGSAALVYFVPFGAAILTAAATVQPGGPTPDRTAFILPLAPVALFALLSSWYLYRGARRLVPGS